MRKTIDKRIWIEQEAQCSGYDTDAFPPTAGGLPSRTSPASSKPSHRCSAAFQSPAPRLTEAAPSACPNPAVRAAGVRLRLPPGGVCAGASLRLLRMSPRHFRLGRDPPQRVTSDHAAPSYANPKYKGCFQVVVTVIYRYDTLVFRSSAQAAPNFPAHSARPPRWLAEY